MIEIKIHFLKIYLTIAFKFESLLPTWIKKYNQYLQSDTDNHKHSVSFRSISIIYEWCVAIHQGRWNQGPRGWVFWLECKQNFFLQKAFALLICALDFCSFSLSSRKVVDQKKKFRIWRTTLLEPVTFLEKGLQIKWLIVCKKSCFT